MPTPRDRSLRELIERWRKEAATHMRHADMRSDPYDDNAHERRVMAKTKRQCADELETQLTAALGGDDRAPQVDVRDSDDFNWALDRIDEIVRTLRVNVQKPDDRDANSVWSWRLDMWADALDSVYSDLRKLRETQLAALPRHDTGSRNEHVEDAGVERAKNPNTDRSRSASTE